MTTGNEFHIVLNQQQIGLLLTIIGWAENDHRQRSEEEADDVAALAIEIERQCAP